MGMWQRFTMIFKSKANKALDRAEDPRETLDYSYEKQLDLLPKVRRDVRTTTICVTDAVNLALRWLFGRAGIWPNQG